MKSISDELKTHLAQEVTTLATCWKVTRRDGTVMGFTDYDAELIVDTVTYQATTGFTPTAVESSAALNVDNLDIEGLLDATTITEQDILAGKYDFAEVEVFLVNYADTSQGRMMLRTGWLGEVRLRGGQFVAELRGLSQQLASHVGEHYAPGCRADLGDARCKINLASYTVTGSVTASDSRVQFADSERTEGGSYFAAGKVTFTSGGNAGLSMEVKAYGNGIFSLALPMPHTIKAGDAYTAIGGCDKTFETCIQVFNNAVNFRGEPHVPGTDKILETSATRSV